MKTISLFLVSILIFYGEKLYSQGYEVPKGYELKVAADYAKYEKDIIGAAKWLKVTPTDEQVEKRKEVEKFVAVWILGSPTVNVEFYPIIMDFKAKNNCMFILYMACAAQYVLENNYSKDNQTKWKAALHDMINVYKSGKGINKDKKMEKLIKADEEGKIDQWIADNFKS